VSGSTLTPVMAAPSGTRFGGWNFNALSDDLRGFGDLDGDGDDEILITSGWGLGLLRLQGSSLTHMRMHASGGTIGGAAYNVATARHGGLGDFDGDGKTDLVLATPAGLMVLGWHPGTGQLRSIAIKSGRGQVLDAEQASRSVQTWRTREAGGGGEARRTASREYLCEYSVRIDSPSRSRCGVVDADGLVAAADEVHLDAAGVGVVDRRGGEAGRGRSRPRARG
jgi:hypothetical protein